MARIFISYSRADESFARRLASSLSDRGVDVWIDVEDIPAGMKWSSAIEQGLRQCEIMIFIISPDSLASKNTEDEWQDYLDTKKPLIPVLYKPVPPADIHFQLRRIQWVDFNRQSYDVAFQQLWTELARNGAKLDHTPDLPLEKRTSATVSPPNRRSKTVFIIGGVAVVVLVAVVVALGVLSNKQLPPTATASVIVSSPTISPATIIVEPIASQTPTPVLTDTPLQIANQGVKSNGDWRPFSPYMRHFNGVEMVLVPKGCFNMGSMDGNDDEKPVTNICLDRPYWIDLTEVTNAEFAQSNSIAAHPSNWTDLTRPRENITWFEARDYCALRGARLPTEAEWEYAARGPDDLVYPWGNDFVAGNVVLYGNSNNQTANVGSRRAGASWVGALDMSGNVWEWVSSLYRPYPYKADDGREDKANRTDGRVSRGGSWFGSGDNIRAAVRNWAAPDSFVNFTGLRCARDYSG